MRRRCLAIMASRISARLALSGERTLLAWMRPQRTMRGMPAITPWPRRAPPPARRPSADGRSPQHLARGFGVHGRREQVALAVVAAHRPQGRELLPGLDAFRDDLQAE